MFFLDEGQRVTFDCISNTFEIECWSRYHEAVLYRDELSSQFSSSGSDGRADSKCVTGALAVAASMG